MLEMLTYMWTEIKDQVRVGAPQPRARAPSAASPHGRRPAAPTG